MHSHHHSTFYQYVTFCHSLLQVLKCQHSSGGFGGSERHDPHMLYTVSAVQVLALYDKLDLLDVDHAVKCKICSQQTFILLTCPETHSSPSQDMLSNWHMSPSLTWHFS